MAVFLNKNRFVSALEQMASPLMTFIKKLGIDPVQLPHSEGEITVRRLDQEVIVVVHHAVGMTEPIVSFINVLERVQEVDAVLVVFENGLLFVSAGGDVIDGTGVFYAEGAGHAAMVSEKRANVKIKDLTLIWLTVVKEKTVSLPLFEFEKDCIGYCSRA